MIKYTSKINTQNEAAQCFDVQTCLKPFDSPVTSYSVKTTANIVILLVNSRRLHLRDLVLEICYLFSND